MKIKVQFDYKIPENSVVVPNHKFAGSTYRYREGFLISENVDETDFVIGNDWSTVPHLYEPFYGSVLTNLISFEFPHKINPKTQ